MPRNSTGISRGAIVVGAEAPKPKVLIVPSDGKQVVGRPKLTDPFAGLPRRRSTSL